MAAAQGSPRMGGDLAADDGWASLAWSGRGDGAGADGPDGLVGDDDGLRGWGLDAVEGAGDLPAEDGFGEAGLALVDGLADADQRHEAVGDGGFELPVDHVVGLVGVDAALGVAEKDVVQSMLASMVGEVWPV
jgi:hypothetical protein